MCFESLSCWESNLLPSCSLEDDFILFTWILSYFQHSSYLLSLQAFQGLLRSTPIAWCCHYHSLHYRCWVVDGDQYLLSDKQGMTRKLWLGLIRFLNFLQRHLARSSWDVWSFLQQCLSLCHFPIKLRLVKNPSYSCIHSPFSPAEACNSYRVFPGVLAASLTTPLLAQSLICEEGLLLQIYTCPIFFSLLDDKYHKTPWDLWVFENPFLSILGLALFINLFSWATWRVHLPFWCNGSHEYW